MTPRSLHRRKKKHSSATTAGLDGHEQMATEPTISSVLPSETTIDVIAMPNRTQSEATHQAGHDVKGQILQKRHHSNLTPRWNKALEKWEKENQKAYQALNEALPGAIEDPTKLSEALSAIDIGNRNPAVATERAKRFQPTLAALRGIAMTASSMDPHKIAPVICAAVFFSIDIILNNLPAAQREKILDIILNCQDTIEEGTSFEKHFTQKSHPAIKDCIPGVENRLDDQYHRILKLLGSIYQTFKRSGSDNQTVKGHAKTKVSERVSKVVHYLSNKIVDWESQSTEISREQKRWRARKKDMDDRIVNAEKVKKVRDWIKKKDDPEPGIDTIRDRVMPRGRYSSAGDWFLQRQEYQDWRQNFLDPENATTDRRSMWINGTYGSGKTTLIYRIYLELKKKQDTDRRSGTLQIIPYFCDASGTGARPDYETILRALIWHTCLPPGRSLSRSAQESFDNAGGHKSDEPAISFWEQLFHEVLQESTYEDQFVFIIDALDECVSLEEAEKLLNFMAKEVLVNHPNIHFLCSSQRQVNVDWYFDSDRCFDVTFKAPDTANDMRKFINGELERREPDQKGSAFYKGENLEKLRTILLKQAEGMFRWVEIWLEICLASSRRHIVRDRTLAEELLKDMQDEGSRDVEPYEKLKLGYKRLWEIYRPRESKNQESRIRLFHIVFAAFRTPSLENLRDALGIQEDSFGKVGEEEILQWCSGFLDLTIVTSPSFGGSKDIFLRWVHASAKTFISDMTIEEAKGADTTKGDQKQFTERNNHLVIANMYVHVLGLNTHPFWDTLAQWNHKTDIKSWIYSHKPLEARPQPTPRFWYFWERRLNKFDFNTFLGYLISQGLNHCAVAAEKASIFDSIWRKVIDRVLLSKDSAYGFLLLLSSPMGPAKHLGHFDGDYKEFLGKDYKELLGKDERDNLYLLRSRIVVHWNVIHEDDISLLSPGKLDKDLQPLFADWADEPLWVHECVGTQKELTRDALDCIFSGDSPAASSVLVEYAKNEIKQRRTSPLKMRYGIPQLLFWTALREPESTVDLLLSFDGNAQPGYLTDALHICLSKRLELVTNTWPEVGANIHMEDRSFDEPSEFFCKLFVQLLLDVGADVNAPSIKGETVLQTTSGLGYGDVVSLVLEAGATIDMQGGRYGTALQAAAAKGRLNVVNQLLEAGATVDVQGGEYGNALQAASANGHLDVVDRLIRAGADVNLQGGQDGTALLAALIGGHQDIADLLIGAGAKKYISSG